MNTVSAALGVVALLGLLLILPGCASSEFEIAQRLDRTSEIIQQASDLIAADAELSRAQIGVDGFKGAMRLKGQVASETHKLRAAKLVWAVPGVKSVVNDLKVQAASSPE